MKDSDRAEFARSLRVTIEAIDMTGRASPSAEALELWWRLLRPFDLEDVQRALRRHAQEAVYVPKPAEIIGRIQRQDGHPDADEAWNIALQAMDEDTTVIWTQQIAAAKSAADPIYQAGDKVGARMAFRAAYEPKLRDARERGVTAHWLVSPGQDPNEREQKVREALDQGRLTSERAQHYLPEPEQPGARRVAGAIRGALEQLTQRGE